MNKQKKNLCEKISKITNFVFNNILTKKVANAILFLDFSVYES